MNSGGPPANGGLGGQDGATNGTHGISTEAAVAALEQHDTLFHRQVMHLRQQQVKLGMSVTMFVFFLSFKFSPSYVFLRDCYFLSTLFRHGSNHI